MLQLCTWLATKQLASCATLVIERRLTQLTSQKAMQNLQMCEHCHKVQRKMKICATCKHAWYCSADCQKAAWPAHKPRCKHMRKLVTTHGLGDGRLPFLHAHHAMLMVHVRLQFLPCQGILGQPSVRIAMIGVPQLALYVRLQRSLQVSCLHARCLLRSRFGLATRFVIATSWYLL